MEDRQSNIRIIGIPEAEKPIIRQVIFEDIIQENFPEIRNWTCRSKEYIKKVHFVWSCVYIGMYICQKLIELWCLKQA